MTLPIFLLVALAFAAGIGLGCLLYMWNHRCVEELSPETMRRLKELPDKINRIDPHEGD